MTARRTVLLAALPSGSVAGSRARAEELTDQSPAQIECGIEAKHPSAYHVLAAKLFRAGRRDEAVFLFYLGDCARVHLAAPLGLEPGGDPALFESLNAVLGRPINRYAFDDIPALVRTIDAVLDWDRDHPDSFTPQSRFRRPTARVDKACWACATRSPHARTRSVPNRLGNRWRQAPKNIMSYLTAVLCPRPAPYSSPYRPSPQRMAAWGKRPLLSILCSEADMLLSASYRRSSLRQRALQ